MFVRRSISVLALVLGASVSTACSEEAVSSASDVLVDDAVTVASFDFVESELLAEVYSQALEAGGYRVERTFGLGPRELVVPALEAGQVELVPEYAGTAVQFLGLGEVDPATDEGSTRASLADVLDDRPITALAPAPAQDANAIVVTRATAERFHLSEVSDLGRAAHTLVFGGPPECASRPLCLGGLGEVYGLRFADVLTLDAGGPLTRQALRNGDIDVALLFTTDPAIGGATGFVELVDDRDLQPAENVTPLVRDEVVDRWGDDLVARVDAVSARLTTDELRDLNAEVARRRLDRADIAAAWLRSEGLG